jgi:tRNA G46 methylase TrmB
LWDDYAIEPQGVLDFAKIFGNTHDVVLEIGFGNGDTLVEMAQANPALNYVGIEVYEAGIGRLINSACAGVNLPERFTKLWIFRKLVIVKIFKKCEG